MRLLVTFLLTLSSPAFAQDISILGVDSARAWVLNEASCDEARGLFLRAPEDARDMSAEDLVRLLFISTYVEGYAKAKNQDFSLVLVHWGRYCERNPTANWLDFEDE